MIATEVGVVTVFAMFHESMLQNEIVRHFPPLNVVELELFVPTFFFLGLFFVRMTFLEGSDQGSQEMDQKQQSGGKPGETSCNILQLIWTNSTAIEAVDALVNVFHTGSPSLLKDQPPVIFWLNPLLSLESEHPIRVFKRIEVSAEPATRIYLTLNVSPWLSTESWTEKFSTLQKQLFVNLVINWVDQEVTVICECLTEGLAICAL